MYDPSIGRWLSEDPIGLEGGDPNLYRYVGNSPTTATDPSGLEALLPIKVIKEGKLADLLKFGGGKLDVKDGPAGTISVATGVDIEVKLPNEKDFQKTKYNNWICIQYKPTNKVTTEKMDFVQFVWFEVKETRGTGTTTVGLPKIASFPEDQVDTQAGPALVSRNPRAPIWIVDRIAGKKTISFIDASLLGTRGPDLAMYDPPGPGMLAEHAKARAMVAGTATGVTEWTVIMHFETYLVYDKKPIYKIAWTATSSITAAGTAPSPTAYKVEDAKPVSSLAPAHITVLRRPEYKDQKELTLP